MTPDTRDVFLCHAREDKAEVVRPLVNSFRGAGISCWYDEAEIQWGDSIVGKVNEGLSISRYVIVVLSPAFMGKNWPQRELNAVLNQEASSGQVKVLPLLVGSEQQKQRILAAFPLLNDKRYLPWDGDLSSVVDAMLSRLGKGRSEPPKANADQISGAHESKIPLPRIRKRFTQRDRDLFLREAFAIVKQYFQQGLAALDRRDEDVEVDLVEVHAFKFTCTVYLRGEMAARCKIWLGGLTTSDSIAYHAGQFSIDSDSAFNDLLSVSDDETRLGFRPSFMGYGGRQRSENDVLTAEQAAEYLWERFTHDLR